MNELPKFVRKELARQQVAAASHPDADLLTAYAEGLATPAERARIDAHLASCEECRGAMFLASGAAPQHDVAPVAVEGPRRTRWFPVWVPWAAAAAMIVAAVGIGVNVRENSSKVGLTSARMAKPESSPTAENKQQVNPRPAAPEPAPAKTKQAAPPPSSAPAKQEDLPPVPSFDGGVVEQQKKDSVPQLARQEQSQVVARRPSAVHGGPSNQSMNQQLAQNIAPYGQIQNNAPVSNSPAQAAAPPRASAGGGEARAKASNAANMQVADSAERADAANQPPQGKVAAAPAPPPPASVTQTVSVEAAAAPVQTESIESLGRNPVDEVDLRALKAADIAWRITSSGGVERLMLGQGWSAVTSLPPNQYKVVATVGRDTWVGGAHAALLHSTDHGQSWKAIPLPAAGEALVTKIEFRDVKHGHVSTADGRSWETSNGGKSWKSVSSE